MKNPSCPHCEKAIHHRHTYMTSFPLTLVCTGCGSWLKLDVKRSGSFVALGMTALTLGLAYFSPYFLILVPLYFVLSMGPLQTFSVELVKKRKAELWTISRRTGDLRPLKPQESEAQRDLQLSAKLAGSHAFRKPRRRSDQFADYKKNQAHHKRPKVGYNLNELPSGLPN